MDVKIRLRCVAVQTTNGVAGDGARVLLQVSMVTLEGKAVRGVLQGAGRDGSIEVWLSPRDTLDMNNVTFSFSDETLRRLSEGE